MSRKSGALAGAPSEEAAEGSALNSRSGPSLQMNLSKSLRSFGSSAQLQPPSSEVHLSCTSKMDSA